MLAPLHYKYMPYSHSITFLWPHTNDIVIFWALWGQCYRHLDCGSQAIGMRGSGKRYQRNNIAYLHMVENVTIFSIPMSCIECGYDLQRFDVVFMSCKTFKFWFLHWQGQNGLSWRSVYYTLKVCLLRCVKKRGVFFLIENTWAKNPHCDVKRIPTETGWENQCVCAWKIRRRIFYTWQ